MATSTAEASAAGSASGNQVATRAPSPAMSPRALIDMRRIQALATRASSMVEQIRGRLLAPEARKISPLYSAAQVAALCGVDKDMSMARTRCPRRLNPWAKIMALVVFDTPPLKFATAIQIARWPVGLIFSCR